MPRDSPCVTLMPCIPRLYSTPREVRIKDGRLSCLYASLTSIVLLYVVVFQLLLYHGYATFESPVGYVNLWPGLSQPWPPANASRHCDTPNDLDWGFDHTPEQQQVTGGYSSVNASCRPFASNTDVIIEASTATALSNVRKDYLDGDGNILRTEQQFPANPEGAVINVIHVYSVGGSARTKFNVKTQILDAGGAVVMTVDEGQVLSAPMGFWLRLAGVDSLDAPHPQGEQIPKPYPAYRVTGLVLLVRMVYTNLRTFELPYYSPLCTITVEALPGAWGFLGSSLAPFPNGTAQHIATQQNGVRVQFIQSGRIGTFSIFEVVLRLVEATVLFNLARFTTDWMAEHSCCFGRRFHRLVSDSHDMTDETTPGCFFRCTSCAFPWADARSTRILCFECGVPRMQDGSRFEDEGGESTGKAVRPSRAVVCCSFETSRGCWSLRGCGSDTIGKGKQGRRAAVQDATVEERLGDKMR